MKFVFLLGGAAGFLTAATTDFLSDRTADRILLDGAIGCLVGALLMRWFWGVLLRGVRETYVARHHAAVAASVPAASAGGPAAPSMQPSFASASAGGAASAAPKSRL